MVVVHLDERRTSDETTTDRSNAPPSSLFSGDGCGQRAVRAVCTLPTNLLENNYIFEVRVADLAGSTLIDPCS